MHISDGILPTWVLAAGWILTIILLVVSIAWSKKQVGNLTEKVPQAAVMTAALFVACMFRIPVPPTSLHLMLAGLAGIMLGPLAFVCIFISLLLQAILLQFGGITVLGVNSLLMGVPALCGYLVFMALSKTKSPSWLSGAVTSFIAVTITTILLGIIFYVSGVDFGSLGAMLDRVSGIPILSNIADVLQNTPGLLTFFMIFLMNIPLMLAEAVISAFILPFIEKVKPEMLEQYHLKQKN
ncbi:CbiM family transporter [Methanimicrococcus blatticola]|uniref:Cobalt/nickel transport system permease protein n=1 Tax=Methanimicrococcus blatticola TaxID=91560 RepID=A0A484F8Z0_9EURY|nr:CbiM family transporter [Methanimicrococcus blatticola]MBZ3935047.1 CbiM family transporter [Methanimicrococcus blatticola]MCC2508856.1 CbiM family transporter [Methanimicrococcus blatticola]TDQ71117.1 cobalt/nickel transport system permease protein [Methanimicrococcus blatticola]